MDKLRSLHYCIAAAEERSFSGAARRLGLSVAGVAQLIGGLERDLGVRLFERSAQGLALTSAGAGYLEACRPVLAQLAEADAQAGASAARASGTVVVGTQTVIAQECLTRALPRFNALYPQIQLDIRCCHRVTDEAARGTDVFLLLGWPQDVGDLVQRQIGTVNFVVCAAPAYWAAHGMPQHPSELERHNCLTIRGNVGVVMDLWQFKRGDERVSVTARGWLVTDNAHRDIVRDVVIAGGGVGRRLDWHSRPGEQLASGALVPALADLGVARGAAGEPAVPAEPAARAAGARVHRFRGAVVPRYRAATRTAQRRQRAAAVAEDALRARIFDARARALSQPVKAAAKSAARPRVAGSPTPVRLRR